MTPRRAPVALVLVGLSFAAAWLRAQQEETARPEAAVAGVEWYTDLDAARRLAAQQDRPLCVVFRCER